MGTLDIITIILFSAAVLATGLSLSGSGKDLKGFFAGGGNIPWGMSGLSLFMGFFSAGTFVVWGSIAYSYGLTAIIIQLTMAVAGFAVGSFIAARWHRTGAITAAEYISNTFGTKTQKTYTFLFLAVSVFTSGSFLYPVAKILEVAADVPLTASILALGIFCIIYTAMGGLRGVMVTDVLQFVILFTAVVIAVPLAFGRIGGAGAFFEKAPEAFFECFRGEYTPWFIFAFCLYNAIFIGGNWSYVQRYTSVRSDRDAKKVGWIMDYLLAEAHLRSGGKIDFPAGFFTPKVGSHRPFGFADGRIGDTPVSLCFLPDEIRVENPYIEYLTAKSAEGNIHVILMNNSAEKQEYRLQCGERTFEGRLKAYGLKVIEISHPER